MRYTVCLIFIFQVWNSALANKCDTTKVYFKPNEAELSSADKSKLDAITGQKISGRGLSVIGYADYVGNEKENLELSKKRADKVVQYLLTKGWKKENMKLVAGKGEVAEERTDTIGNEANRRVDVIPFYRFPATEANDIIYFRPGTDTIQPDNKYKLKKLLDVMQENPCLKISVEGHTCCGEHKQTIIKDDGTKYWANSISRADVIINYLTVNGIGKERLQFNAVGTGRPLVKNPKDAEQHAKNSRVEIKVIE